MSVGDNESHGGHELGSGDDGQQYRPTGEEEALNETDAAGGDLIETEPADPADVIAATDPKHEQKFRWWALGVIAGLCVFFALATLLVGALASGDAAGQIASDMAKTAIPTLLTLLGTAVAWAFKSERDG